MKIEIVTDGNNETVTVSKVRDLAAARNGMVAFSKFRNCEGFSEQTVLACLTTPFFKLAIEGVSGN